MLDCAGPAAKAALKLISSGREFTWGDMAAKMNHAIGFKKFSSQQIAYRMRPLLKTGSIVQVDKLSSIKIFRGVRRG